MRILVTGAASGIGAATAALLRAQGIDVVELDVRERPGSIACDLGDPNDIRRAAEQIGAPLDGVAHVAGVPGTFAPDRVLAINYLGPRLLTELLVPRVRAGGAFVFVSSLASHRCTWPDSELTALASEPTWEDAFATIARRGVNGSDAYDLSKRLLAFTLADLVAGAAPLGIRVNLVSPGPVETPILDDFRTTMGAERIDAAARLAGRHGRPGDIANVVAFLLGPEAGWLNGVDLVADGGLSALRKVAERKALA
jgi:NAD(P)-dependent dehydrogenase (short-subunit alcohol dehydrogenase family)